MDTLPNILADKRHELEAESDGRPAAPEALGRALALAVPRTWKVTVYAVLLARIPKAEWHALFVAFFDEQAKQPLKLKRAPTGEYIEDDEEETHTPRQLTWI